MALISCPNCGKQVSDKAEVCPACDYKLNIESTDTNCCPDCGSELTPDCKVCPSCGCPISNKESPQKVEVTGVSINSTNKKTIIIIVSVIVVIAIAVVVGVSISNNIKEAQEREAAAQAYEEEMTRIAEYKSNLEYVVREMFLGAAAAETAGGLIHDVWYNTIYEESDSATDKFTKVGGEFNEDFNTSLMMLFIDEDFNEDIDFIKQNQEEVKECMKDLTNPPDECKEAYNALKQYYDAYLEFTNLAVNPTGNLSSFTSSFNESDSEVLNCYQAMDIYLD